MIISFNDVALVENNKETFALNSKDNLAFYHLIYRTNLLLLDIQNYRHCAGKH